MAPNNLPELNSKRTALLQAITLNHPNNSGVTTATFQAEVEHLHRQQQSLLQQYQEKQATLAANIRTLSETEVQLIQTELQTLCQQLTTLNQQLIDAQQALAGEITAAQTLTPEQKQAQVDKLAEELKKIEDQIKDQLAQTSPPPEGLQLIWIQQAFGIYLLIDLQGMIKGVMGGLFAVLQPMVPLDQFQSIIQKISDPEQPGLASLLKAFIETLIKSVGQFAIYFFAIKMMVDLLAGLEISKIMSQAIKILTTVLQELTQLLSDAPKLILKKLVGPIFEMAIPIPAFTMDLAQVAAFLPFLLKIPKIDPYGLFQKLTPFNSDAVQAGKEIPLDWKEKYFDGAKAAEKELQNQLDLAYTAQRAALAQKIQAKQEELAGLPQQKLAIQIEATTRLIKLLTSQLNYEQRNYKENKEQLSATGIKEAEERMQTLCQELTAAQAQLNSLQVQAAAPLDLDAARTELAGLEAQQKNLESDPPVAKELAKRALLLNIEQDLGLNDLGDRLTNLRLEGYNVFSDALLQALMDIGYNLKDADYLPKLQQLKTYGVDLNSLGQLGALAFIGLNLNDGDYPRKLQQLQSLGIKINQPELLGMYGQLGFNLNSTGAVQDPFAICQALKSQNIPLTDRSYLQKMYQLGFNFNLKNGVTRFLTLKKYADLSLGSALDNLLRRNVNLNNPFFETILEKYYRLGFNFDSGDFMVDEAWLLSYATPADIDIITTLLAGSKVNPGTGVQGNVFVYDQQQIFMTEWALFYAQVQPAMAKPLTDDQYSYSWSSLPLNGIPTPLGMVEEVVQFQGQVLPLNRILYHTDGYLYYALLVEPNVSIFGPPAEPGLLPGYHWEKLKQFSLKDVASFINRYARVGIKLDIPLTGTSFGVERIDNQARFEVQLQSLRQFVVDGGWKINGVTIAEAANGPDLNQLATAFGLTVVTDINYQANQIQDTALKNSLANVDRLGLNVRDPLYLTKLNLLRDKIKYSVQSSYYDTSNPNVVKTVVMKKEKQWNWMSLSMEFDADDEGTVLDGKVNPDYFTDSNIKLEYKKIVLDQSKLELKDRISISVLSRLGLNLTQDNANNLNHNTILDTLNSWNLDITQTTAEDDIKALLGLGFHFNQALTSQHITALNQLKFSFGISNLGTKLNFLTSMGFHFTKPKSDKMLQTLANRGLFFTNHHTVTTNSDAVRVDWFETQLGQLNQFGINFNDPAWEAKYQKFDTFGINFTNPEWRAQMDTLNLLGITFTTPDWEQSLERMVALKKLGLDPKNLELRSKLVLLNNMGVDFTAPADTYLEKLEALIAVGAINITADNTQEKQQFQTEQTAALTRINDQLLVLGAELSGHTAQSLQTALTKLQAQQQMYLAHLAQNQAELVKNPGIETLQELDADNKKTCRLLTTLEQQIQEAHNKLKNYQPRSATVIQPEIDQLHQEKLTWENKKVYRLNRVLTITTVDKLKALVDTGLNFKAPDWAAQLQKLLDQGADLNLPNWQDLFQQLAGLLTDAVLAWVMGIVNVLITTITFPLSILMNFVTQLMSFITALLAIPLNPADIPEWAKGIIVEFQTLVKMIITLPTPKGVLDLLLKVIDGILPGFSGFLETVKNLISSFPTSVETLQTFITTQTANLAHLRQLYAEERTQLEQEIAFRQALLQGQLPLALQQEQTKTNTQLQIAGNQLAQITTLSKETTDPLLLAELAKQQAFYCKLLTEMTQALKDQEQLAATLIQSPPNPTELGAEIAALQTQLAQLDSKYASMFATEKELNKAKAKLKELVDAVEKLANFCEWNKNIDAVIGILESFLTGLKLETNPFQQELEFARSEVTRLEAEIKTLTLQIDALQQGTTTSPLLEALNQQLTTLDRQIAGSTNTLCAQQDTMTKDQVNQALVELQNLKQRREDLLKSIQSQQLTPGEIAPLQTQRQRAQARLLEFKTLATQADLSSQNFELQLQVDLAQYDTVLKWFGVATNLLCNLPKIIVNTIAGILNGVGKMGNLPTLWNFPMME